MRDGRAFDYSTTAPEKLAKSLGAVLLHGVVIVAIALDCLPGGKYNLYPRCTKGHGKGGPPVGRCPLRLWGRASGKGVYVAYAPEAHRGEGQVR